jgi:hypothetical protein
VSAGCEPLHPCQVRNKGLLRASASFEENESPDQLQLLLAENFPTSDVGLLLPLRNVHVRTAEAAPEGASTRNCGGWEQARRRCAHVCEPAGEQLDAVANRR